MRLSSFFLRIFALLVVPASLATLALYLYPVLFSCQFPLPFDDAARTSGSHAPRGALPVAPFRLLALGDPQLEGDSSLPDPNAPFFPSLVDLANSLDDATSWTDQWNNLQDALYQCVANDVPRLLQAVRKRIDLLGNDYYLAHIYRSLHWWTQPTHVSVLGDLIGSQWVSDDEFEWRGWRFWNRVFKHAQRVPDQVMSMPFTESLGADPAWSRRLINPAGNHDIGYAGDITTERLERYEKMYGLVNWDVTFELGPGSSNTTVPELRIVVINSMNLDSPTSHPESQEQTYDFVNNFISRLRPVEDSSSAVIAITHVPLQKDSGICVDGPYFTYKDGGIREQNHLSSGSSEIFRRGIFGLDSAGQGRDGLILNGHDHEGCDTIHRLVDVEDGDSQWHVQRIDDTNQTMSWNDADRTPKNIREITLRSMMGMYGGYAGLVSAWFDESQGRWQFATSSCALGVQHIWWAVHVADLVTLIILGVGLLARAVEYWSTSTRKAPIQRKTSNDDIRKDTAVSGSAKKRKHHKRATKSKSVQQKETSKPP